MPKVSCKTTATKAMTTGVGGGGGGGDGEDSVLLGEFTAGCGETTPSTTASTTGSGNAAKDSRQLKPAAIKKEKVDSPPGEQVFHRKSERRRVARDIFLIFEEQPSSRRRGPRAGGANRKPARPAKPKFGHLKVEEPNTHNHNNNNNNNNNNSKTKGLLRDIKNEPKCYLNAVAAVHTAAAGVAATALPAAALSSVVGSNNNNVNSSNNNINNVNNKSNNHVNTNNAHNGENSNNKKNNNNNKRSKLQKVAPVVNGNAFNVLAVTGESKPQTQPPALLPPPPAHAAAKTATTTTPTSAAVQEDELITTLPLPPPQPQLPPPLPPVPTLPPQSECNTEKPIARVNPIFLWVKQDDTRIVEVRCEDYDKRNRIRLTKTTNGWRAIPRTDPTTSRVVKYFQTSTPLIKVKREIYEATSREVHQRLNDIAFNNLKSAAPPTPLPEGNEFESLHNMQALSPPTVVPVPQEEYVTQAPAAVEVTAPMLPLQVAKNQKPRGRGRKKKKKAGARAKKKTTVGAAGVETAASAIAAEAAQQLTSAVDDELPPPQPQPQPPPMLLLAVSKSEHADEEQQRMLESQETSCNQLPPMQTLPPTQLLEYEKKPQEVEEEEEYADLDQTYQAVPTLELQLCPKTGLFLPPNASAAIAVAAANESGIDVNSCAPDSISLHSNVGADGCGDILARNLVHCDFVCSSDDDIDDENKHITHVNRVGDCGNENHNDNEVQEVTVTAANIIQNLDAETKNLKDLLDDADLLQHCGVGDNINSGAELIDSLVKRSCENNLIQEASTNELLKDAFAISTAAATVVASNHLHHHHDLTRHLNATSTENADVSSLPTHLIDSVSEPPKCLSFNEAGEIEGLNCELFQSSSMAHNFIGTFDVDDVDDKEPSSSPLIGVVLDDVEEVTLSAKARSQHQDTTDLCDEQEDMRTREADEDKELDADADKLTDVRMEDDTPKDLSYKKREEVCPPSESRSQCAVTSSSDVVKSPTSSSSLSLRQDETLAPTAALESTSETIKNLILEQFIKLNALNGITTSASAPNATKQQLQQQQQQSEPIDLGKHRDSVPATTADDSTGDGGGGYAASTNYIDTVVVIDDNSDDEPVKKRLRNTINGSNSCSGGLDAASSDEKSLAPQQPTTAPLIIDKDPDPLTQLQLLLRNTAWKVPDPILVPKDRLGAVLASPAREIPLLITTRPELRLPEAFAYPEIIQNPNILVISMAQLEAILKNEMEVEKTNAAAALPVAVPPKPTQQQQHRTIACEFPTAAATAAAAVVAADNNNGMRKLNQVQDLQMTCAPLQQTEPKINAMQQQQQPKEMSTKCSHLESSNSASSSNNNNNNSLASDINAATLAVLNQMLWLPYFGQLSQEFMKSLKEPVVGLQNKFAGLLPPPPPPSLFNHQFGLQHLDELYKTYMKQINNLKHISSPSPHIQPTPQPQPQPLATPNYPSSMGAFQNPVELAIFQKILQHQMHNFLNLNPLGTDSNLPSSASVSSASSSSAPAPTPSSQRDSMAHKQQHSSSNEHSSNIALMNSIEQQKRSRKSLANHTTPLATTFANDHHSSGANVGIPTEKSHCLKRIKSNCDNSTAENSELSKLTAGGGMQKQQQQQQAPNDNKPRLTCKSLSNLLEPENMTSATVAATAAVPLVNLTSDSIRNITTTTAVAIHDSGSGGKQLDNKQIPSISKEPNCLPTSDSTFRSARTNHSNKVVPNPILNSFDAASKHRKRSIHFAESGTAAATAETTTSSARSSAAGIGAIDPMNAESNPALWHPLFGSNTKPGYSSPWQWTTVTATGE